MSCCCTSVLKICNVTTCDDIEIPVPVSSDGYYFLRVYFLSSIIDIKQFQSIGDSMTFPSELLNENFTYIANILDEDLNIISFTVDEKEYDCISFSTKIKLWD